MSKEDLKRKLEGGHTKLWVGAAGLMAVALLANGLNSEPIPFQGTPDPHGLGEPYLSQTATALAGTPEGRVRTQFKPEKGFSREMFEKMRQGTFILTFSDFKGEGAEMGSIQTTYGTAWLVNHPGDYQYLVTNRHVIEDSEFNAKSVMLRRPLIDRRVIRAKVEGVYLSDQYDVGILKVKLDPKTKLDKPLVAFDYEDDAKMEGKKVLPVGVPASFYGPNLNRASVWGKVVIVKNEQGNYVAVDINGPGSSGSPAAVERNGKIVVLGMIYAGTYDINWKISIMITPMDIAKGIEELESR